MIDNLLSPFNSDSLGLLKNRVVMSAMSRSFAGANHTCTDDIAAYYHATLGRVR